MANSNLRSLCDVGTITLGTRTECRRRALTIVAALLVGTSPISNPLRAQAGSPVLWTPDSIHSRVLGSTRKLRIALPLDYDAPENAMERYAVLIVFDADGEEPFTATAANVRALSARSGAVLPRMIVVGVYSGSTRYHDMTPPPDDSVTAPGAGGAPAFLQFLSTELRPYIAARYRGTYNTTVLVGHSLSGLFTNWAFGHAPQFVTGGIALSPSPNLDGLKSAGQQVREGLMTRTAPGRLFILTSTSEDGLDSANTALAAILRARPRPGWEFEHQRISGASHSTTELVGVVPGLRFVFRPASLDGLMWHNDGTDASVSKLIVAFDSARAVYVHGAEELNLPPRLPFLWLINQSNSLTAPWMARLKLHLCEATIDFYPSRWNGFECAGDTEVQMGRQTEAAVNYRRGAEAARTAGDSAAAERMVRKERSLRGAHSG